MLVMVLFAVALDSEPLVLRAAAGLVWLAMLFSTMLVVQRAFDIETADAAIDTLLACAVHPARVFFGKALALFVQLFALVVVLVTAAIVLYGVTVSGSRVVLLVTVVISATSGLALVGTLYGAVVANMNGRDSLLPLLALLHGAALAESESEALGTAPGTAQQNQ